MAIDLPRIVQQYLAAWNQHDATARMGLLEAIWADDATYVEAPGMAEAPVVGRTEMSALIAQNQGSPSDWFEPRAWHEGYAHHDLLIMPWRHCTVDGPSGVIGTDYAELNAYGQITLAVGFSPLTPDGSGIDEQPTAVCAEPASFDWSGVPAIVGRYTAAWNAPTSAERGEILSAIADDETPYFTSWDPLIPVGPTEMAEFIHRWAVPGNYFEPNAWGDADQHDGWFHVRWQECAPTGEALGQGIELLRVDSEGLLSFVASFASW